METVFIISVILSVFVFSLSTVYLFNKLYFRYLQNQGEIQNDNVEEEPMIIFVKMSEAKECFCLDTEKGDKCVKLICGHVFHANCIKKWVKINPICPVCRVNLLKKD